MPETHEDVTRIIEVLDNDELYRRINSLHQLENGKISSGAFKHRRPLSVDIAKLTTPENSLSNHTDCWLSVIMTGFVRSLELKVYHRPKNNNYAHGEIEGKINKVKARKLARSARLVI